MSTGLITEKSIPRRTNERYVNDKCVVTSERFGLTLFTQQPDDADMGELTPSYILLVDSTF